MVGYVSLPYAIFANRYLASYLAVTLFAIFSYPSAALVILVAIAILTLVWSHFEQLKIDDYYAGLYE